MIGTKEGEAGISPQFEKFFISGRKIDQVSRLLLKTDTGGQYIRTAFECTSNLTCEATFRVDSTFHTRCSARAAVSHLAPPHWKQLSTRRIDLHHQFTTVVTERNLFPPFRRIAKQTETDLEVNYNWSQSKKKIGQTTHILRSVSNCFQAACPTWILKAWRDDRARLSAITNVCWELCKRYKRNWRSKASSWQAWYWERGRMVMMVMLMVIILTTAVMVTVVPVIAGLFRR